MSCSMEMYLILNVPNSFWQIIFSLCKLIALSYASTRPRSEPLLGLWGQIMGQLELPRMLRARELGRHRQINLALHFHLPHLNLATQLFNLSPEYFCLCFQSVSSCNQISTQQCLLWQLVAIQSSLKNTSVVRQVVDFVEVQTLACFLHLHTQSVRPLHSNSLSCTVTLSVTSAAE